MRLKFLARLNTDCKGTEARPVVALEHLDSWTGSLVDGVELLTRDPSAAAGVATVEPGDVLFGKLRPYLAKTWLADRQVYASTELLCLRPAPGVNPSWFAFLMSSQPVIDWAVATSDGTKMPRTSWEALGEFRVHLPGESTQEGIARFLQRETDRIDGLIAAKRRMTQLLDQRWQSIMSAGVSGRLTPSQGYRTSAIPWLTNIPMGWREAKLNLLARLGSGHTPSRKQPEWWDNPSIPWITTGEVEQVRNDRVEYVNETREMISELGMANSSATLHPVGTVVLCRTASAGYSAIMGRDMATSQDFATWTCGPLLKPRFLLLCLRVMRQDLLGRLAMGSTHQTIYMPEIESIKVPLPSVDEQDAVVAAVYGCLPAIDQAISDLDRQVRLLLERRQAVISAALTGALELPKENVA